MKRIVWNGIVAVSLLLLMLSCVAWMRSYKHGYVLSVSNARWPSNDVCINRYLSARIVVGHWLVYWGRDEYDLTVPDVTRFHHAMTLSEFRSKYSAGTRWDLWSFDVFIGQRVVTTADGTPSTQTATIDGYLLQVPRRYGFGFRNDPPRTWQGRTEAMHYVVAPVWPVAVGLAVLPIIWMLGRLRRRRRRRAGLCWVCGYDLRASPLRCPECGQSHSTRGVSAMAQ